MSTASETDALREAIVRGDLAQGSRLVEADLSRDFSLSRGAVRTALVRLEQEGLVTREHNRGARVRHIGDDEAIEILEARAALEGLAAAEAARRIDARGTRQLQKALERHTKLIEAGDLMAASDANAALHELLLELSGHATAQQLIRTLKSQTVRFQFRTILVPGRPASSNAEHAAIVAAVVEGKPRRAEKAMRDHLFSVADALRVSQRAG